MPSSDIGRSLANRVVHNLKASKEGIAHSRRRFIRPYVSQTAIWAIWECQRFNPIHSRWWWNCWNRHRLKSAVCSIWSIWSIWRIFFWKDSWNLSAHRLSWDQCVASCCSPNLGNSSTSSSHHVFSSDSWEKLPCQAVHYRSTDLIVQTCPEDLRKRGNATSGWTTLKTPW